VPAGQTPGAAGSGGTPSRRAGRLANTAAVPLRSISIESAPMSSSTMAPLRHQSPPCWIMLGRTRRPDSQMHGRSFPLGRVRHPPGRPHPCAHGMYCLRTRWEEQEQLFAPNRCNPIHRTWGFPSRPPRPCPVVVANTTLLPSASLSVRSERGGYRPVGAGITQTWSRKDSPRSLFYVRHKIRRSCGQARPPATMRRETIEVEARPEISSPCPCRMVSARQSMKQLYQGGTW
jgi:hypothetical protein